MALLAIKELSAWLNLKPSTLYLWVAQGKIPALKIHGRVRFRCDDIERWLESFRLTVHRVPPRSHPGQAIDDLIAAAKREVYTPSCGKPDQDRATRKGENDGSV
jgi:excisionase family DNA binding protein